MLCVANFENPFPEDADDVDAPALPAASSSSSEEDDDSDEEEEESLLRELNKIKQERLEEEKAKVSLAGKLSGCLFFCPRVSRSFLLSFFLSLSVLRLLFLYDYYMLGGIIILEKEKTKIFLSGVLGASCLFFPLFPLALLHSPPGAHG